MALKVLGVDASQFPEVSVDVQPLAEDGQPLVDLSASQVRVIEDGVEMAGAKVRVQRLSALSGQATAHMSVIIAIVHARGLDRQAVGTALSGLTKRLGEGVEACVVIQKSKGADKGVERLGVLRPRGMIWQKFTDVKELVAPACQDYELARTSLLYEVLMFALSIERDDFAPVIVVSDGFDDGSRFAMQQVIDKARETGRPVFCVGIKTGVLRKRYEPAPLIAIARHTGGKFYVTDGEAPMTWLYDDLEAFRRSQYRISYQSTNADPDRQTRQVVIHIAAPGYQPAAASVPIEAPRAKILAEQLRRARTRLDALTSGAAAHLMDGGAALREANVKIIEGAQWSSNGKLDEAAKRFDAAREAIGRARQAAQEALAAVAKTNASDEEAVDGDVRQAIEVAEKQRKSAAEIQASAASVERNLDRHVTALMVRRLVAKREEIKLDSPELAAVLEAVAKQRAEMKPEVYADVHRRLSSLLMGHAIRLFEQGQFDAAGDVCQQVLAVLPDDVPGTTNADAHTLLGQCLEEQALYAKAEKQYREAIQRQPQNALARLGLARTLRKLKRPADALREAKAAAGLDPQNADTQKLIGELAYESGDYEAAAKYMALAVRAHPSLRVPLADCYERLKKADRAIEVYRNLLADGAGTPRDHARFVCLLWQTGRNEKPEELVKHCRLALQSDELTDAERARTLNVLGICLYNLGAWDEGVRDCAAAVKLAPELGQDHPVLR